MNQFNREEYLFLSKVAEFTERFHDMIEFVKKIEDKELSKEERNVLASAYNNLVGQKRAELRVLKKMEKEEEMKFSNQQLNICMQNYMMKIEAELQEKCIEIIKLTRDVLLQNAQQIENQVFYLKMIGDYNRYLAEFHLENDQYNAEEQAEQAYMEAIHLTQSKLSPTLPLFLRLMLNASVFYYEVKGELEKAKIMAAESFERGVLFLDRVKEEHMKDYQCLLQLLSDNIKYWEQQID